MRQDNGDRRLTPVAEKIGLAGEQRVAKLKKKESEIELVSRRLEKERVEEVTMSKWLRRPEIGWEQVVERVPELGQVSADAAQQVVFDLKYAGYIARQDVEIERQRRMAERQIPDSLDYEKLSHMRNEAREKLAKIRPLSLAQAGRISGITPADIALLMAYLDR